MRNRPGNAYRNPMARAGATVIGGTLVLIGILLLVLPGPGLLLVFAGLLVLAKGIPSVERYIAPVRTRAMDAAEQSVTTKPRIALSILAGLGLMGSGVVWGVVPGLPFGGWATGSSLILSGILLLALLVYSYRRHRRHQKSGVA